jgi:molybdate transport system permease protein
MSSPKAPEPTPAEATATEPAEPASAAPVQGGRGDAPAGYSDGLFVAGLGTLLGSYVALIAGLLFALALFTSPAHLLQAIGSEEIRFALRLSLISCTLSTLFSLWVAIPSGYMLSRYRFPGRNLVDAVLDIPIVLPPLVIGLALLILFQTPLGRAVERVIPVTFAVPSIVLAQFTVACAFAVRTMRITFDQVNPRAEQVALTLGCSRAQAFWMVALPEARRGVLTAATLAWARALGEFGPILVFSGATRMRTEVLPTTVFLELSIGNIEAAAAVSLMMVFTALLVLILARMFGLRGTGLL